MTPPVLEIEQPFSVIDTEEVKDKPRATVFTRQQIEDLLDTAFIDRHLGRNVMFMDVPAPPDREYRPALPLSEALLEGCKIKPNKIRKSLFDHKTGACAIGAIYAYAYETEAGAMYPRPQSSDSIKQQALVHTYPQLEHSVISPINGSTGGLMDTIMDLNDNQGWSREDIAGWLGQLGL